MEDHIVAPTIPHTHTVVFLHDRHKLAIDCAALLLEARVENGLTLSQLFPSIKWVFPQAADRYSERFDCDLSQWFDIWSIKSPHDMEEIQEEGLNESFERILGVIDREVKLVDSYQHVILGGHGMGCAVGILALFQGLHKLGGFMGISGWLPFCRDLMSLCPIPSQWKATALSNFKQRFYYTRCEDGDGSMIFDGWQIPIILVHAMDDDVVPLAIGRQMRQTLSGIFRRSDFPTMDIQMHVHPNGGHLFNGSMGVVSLWRFIKRVTGVGEESKEGESGEGKNDGENNEGDNKNKGNKNEHNENGENKDEDKKSEENKEK
ncbi:hypothetical protein sscle_08g066890 [Sclerotinia sclerotiorum 1980 UF-70]|nr:hypothetical protein sscle_08g066890 [Sclerotinia sclerotiorum 1980 UF-70]